MGRRWGVSCAAVVMMVSMNVVAAGPSGAMSATQLRGDALTLRQMPAGWFTHAPVGDPRLGCLAHLLEPAKVNETNYLEVYFVAKSDLPFVVETLTTYSSTASAFSKIASRLASCRSISGDLDGYRVTGTVRPVTVGRFGTASVTYRIEVKGAHYTVMSYYAVVRKGSVIFAVLETDYPSVSLSQFRGFVVRAYAKVK